MNKAKQDQPITLPALITTQAVYLGFTADDDMTVSRIIQRATDGIWSHMFVAFKLASPDANRVVYYEALLGSGVTGPWPIERLLAWAEDKRTHRYCMLALETGSQAKMQGALTRAMSAVGKQSYGKTQIVAMALSERYGLPVFRSQDRTVCSEFAAWVVQDIVDLRDRRRRIWDQVNPNSAWRRLAEERAGVGNYTSLVPRIPPTPNPKPEMPSKTAQEAF